MEQKNDALLPCQKETALENIESSMNLYDMPEHQDTLAVEGWALSELVDEVKRWRDTHKAGEFSPDYCAASEALAEHLEHCARPTPAPLSKGDADKLNNAIEILTKMGREVLPTSWEGTFFESFNVVKAAALTPSPVAVDAKAGVIMDEEALKKEIRKVLNRSFLNTEHKRDCMAAVTDELERHITAPKPDSKE